MTSTTVRRSPRFAKRKNEEDAPAAAPAAVPAAALAAAPAASLVADEPSPAPKRRKNSKPRSEPAPTSAPKRRVSRKRRRPYGKRTRSRSPKRRRHRSPSPDPSVATDPVDAQGLDAPVQDPPAAISPIADAVIDLTNEPDVNQPLPASAAAPRQSRNRQRTAPPNRLATAPAAPAIAAPLVNPLPAMADPGPMAAPTAEDVGTPWVNFGWMGVLLFIGWMMLKACQFASFLNVSDVFLLAGTAIALFEGFKKAKAVWNARETVVSPPEPEFPAYMKPVFGFLGVVCFFLGVCAISETLGYKLTTIGMFFCLQLLRMKRSTLPPMRFRDRLKGMFRDGLKLAGAAFFWHGKLLTYLFTALGLVIMDVCVWSLLGGPGSFINKHKERVRPYFAAAKFFFGMPFALAKFLIGKTVSLAKFIRCKIVVLAKFLFGIIKALGKFLFRAAWALFKAIAITTIVLFIALVLGVFTIALILSCIGLVFQNFWLVQQPWLTNYMESIVKEPYYNRPWEHHDVIELCGNLNMKYGTELTKANVKNAFRQESPLHHPDKGGKPEDFRKLMDARDDLLLKLPQPYVYSHTWLFEEPCLVNPDSYFPVCSMN